jgi:peptide/nickel transport system permease protein
MIPGDPVLLFYSQSSYASFTPEELDAKRHELGLDQSIPKQYIDWVANVFQGDFGKSIIRQSQVTDEIKKALPVSIFIGLITWVFAHLLAIPAGIVCAVKRGTWIDNIITSLANFGITIPVFWLGVLLIYVFGLTLGWLPIFGYTSPFDDFWLSIKKIIMPVFCLALTPLSGCVRQTRSAMLEVIHQDYIRTARSKGLTEKVIILKHALKNGIIPVVTLAGMSIPIIIGGQVLVETVFGIPGIGRLSVDALFTRDYPIIQGIILIIAVLVVVCNLLVDISYGWLDPRIRYN